MSDLQGGVFLKASITCKLSFLSVFINVSNDTYLYDTTPFCLLFTSLKNWNSFFDAIEKLDIVADWLLKVKLN